ncbi:hypothetical protein PCL_01518 [Purpureocillium lilacinum]|uniref:Uncharacterized protein n=1 Tax=Purpureocillium lilacinum TaxID=33203 RepID=A0A2U3E3P9_PURLI|nr:hypothetical protein PCL_01518 [Purpureocillium lilacinum]
MPLSLLQREYHVSDAILTEMQSTCTFTHTDINKAAGFDVTAGLSAASASLRRGRGSVLVSHYLPLLPPPPPPPPPPSVCHHYKPPSSAMLWPVCLPAAAARRGLRASGQADRDAMAM